ncbi:hypothetical protein [Marinomonas ostreistagni]|uniref:Cobalt ABC transporter permease n=1 Tax=Marinomonas ostreistagni TaxID=359209 RepID=A0ABS0ZE90_9GAMM|nr:hypothetical protein [Marinomonas ostreistagni]MBJ7552000.1 hypothetical protein [Marinomonas ostreistagni]
MARWRFILTVLCMCSSFMVQAHNVISGVYAIGSTIEGEIGFSNGDMAAEGTEVIVFDSLGNELGRVKTDAEGLFAFEAKKRIDHFFYANMSSGHVMEEMLPADQLPESLSGDVISAENSDTKQASKATSMSTSGMDQAELEAMIEKAVAKQVKPLRQELMQYQAKAGMQDILGGIGYIFGLCGLGIWWRQRQKEKQEKANA